MVKKSTPFQPCHALMYAVEAISKDAKGCATCWCLFCVHEGRDDVGLGQNYHFLGCRIIRGRPSKKLWMIQDGFIKSLVSRFHLEDAASIETPMDPHQVLEKAHEDYAEDKNLREQYQSLIGSLLWPSIITRLDISFAVTMLSRFLGNPTQEHLSAAKRVLRYLKGSQNTGLLIDGSKTPTLGRRRKRTGNIKMFTAPFFPHKYREIAFGSSHETFRPKGLARSWTTAKLGLTLLKLSSDLRLTAWPCLPPFGFTTFSTSHSLSRTMRTTFRNAPHLSFCRSQPRRRVRSQPDT